MTTKQNTLTLTLDTQAKADHIRTLANNTKGRFFSVAFIKADKSERLMTCRLGVKSPLVGGENTVARITKYLTVWDTKVKQYRNVNLETVFMFHSQGNKITFKDVA